MLLNCGVGEDSWESPLDCKIKPNNQGNQTWIFIRRIDAGAEAPILWSPDSKSWLTAKDPDAGKDWRQEEKGMTEDEMVGWHHWLNGHEFEQAPGDGEGQGTLVCCSPGVSKSQTRLSDWTATTINLIGYRIIIRGSGHQHKLLKSLNYLHLWNFSTYSLYLFKFLQKSKDSWRKLLNKNHKLLIMGGVIKICPMECVFPLLDNDVK